MNPPVKVNPAKNEDATEFLTFAETFSTSPADLQKQALIETNRALALNPNDLLHRMKLVMIYGLPNSSLGDTAKAQQPVTANFAGRYSSQLATGIFQLVI